MSIGDHTLAGPVTAAEPFAVAPAALTLNLDGVDFADPAALLRILNLGPRGDRLADEVGNSVDNPRTGARLSARTGRW